MDLGALPVWIARGDALAEEFEAAHLRFDPTSDVIAGPVLLVRPAEALARTQDLVAGVSGRAVLLPQAAVPADGDDGSAAAIHVYGVTTPGVESTVAGHGADLFIPRDLIQQVRQHRAVTFAA